MKNPANKGDFLEITLRDDTRRKMENMIFHTSNPTALAEYMQAIFDKYGTGLKIVPRDADDNKDELAWLKADEEFKW